MYIGLIIEIVVLIAVLVFLFSARSGDAGGAVQLSHLKCPKCASEFDYAFVPGASFTSVRLGTSRYIRCPVCHKWSVFDLRSTRVDPKTHHCENRIGPS
jgi:hypothetical protein